MPESGEVKPVSGQRPRRRGRRGSRGRGRGSRPPMSLVTPAAEGQPTTETAPLLEAVAEVAGKISPPRQPQPPRTSAIRQAIEEVGEIVEALKRVLDQMEEVLELAEMVERQKTADEQEIESLRRALRQLQRPGGNRHRGDGEPQS